MVTLSQVVVKKNKSELSNLIRVNLRSVAAGEELKDIFGCLSSSEKCRVFTSMRNPERVSVFGCLGPLSIKVTWQCSKLEFLMGFNDDIVSRVQERYH